VDFRVRGPLSRWKYRSCHRIIAASRAIAKVLEEAGVPAARLRLVYEGVPDRPAQQGGAEALRELGVPPGSPVVGNVAALADHKDHATLLAAASRVVPRLPDVRFVIVGEGERRRALETLARSLGLGERCIVAGFRRDLDRLIPAFSVFCLSSHMEGLGTSLLDAMTFCVPIVATAAGGIPEVVEDGVTGFLVPIRDPVALAEALFQVLADPKRRSQMASAGRQRYERLFTAERMVDETIGVFEELLRPS
jgi:glycosyltransferase involved in cell wall biosynthesis